MRGALVHLAYWSWPLWPIEVEFKCIDNSCIHLTVVWSECVSNSGSSGRTTTEWLLVVSRLCGWRQCQVCKITIEWAHNVSDWALKSEPATASDGYCIRVGIQSTNVCTIRANMSCLKHWMAFVMQMQWRIALLSISHTIVVSLDWVEPRVMHKINANQIKSYHCI